MAKKPRSFPFTFGGDPEILCEECQLPCTLEEMNLDCHRRFFLRGLLRCSYFVKGYCFLSGVNGCVFDNGGRHETYWLNLLNDYYHDISGKDKEADFAKNAEEVRKLVDDEIEKQNVYLCRYIEELYNEVMKAGGGLSEDMLSELDEAYLSLLKGIIRKPD
ncbi:MAG: hypothetical protein B6D63_01490 [Candidatus Latescibacteria bacterium 4484_7]|nr:MAG: hypothetical protein B6D63_01490 [Candidatus Latescibacteria bacterium 4484_7]